MKNCSRAKDIKRHKNHRACVRVYVCIINCSNIELAERERERDERLAESLMNGRRDAMGAISQSSSSSRPERLFDLCAVYNLQRGCTHDQIWLSLCLSFSLVNGRVVCAHKFLCKQQKTLLPSPFLPSFPNGKRELWAQEQTSSSSYSALSIRAGSLLPLLPRE